MPTPDNVPDADGIVWRHGHRLGPARHGLWRLLPRRWRRTVMLCDLQHEVGQRVTDLGGGQVKVEVFMRHVPVDWQALEAQMRKGMRWLSR